MGIIARSPREEQALLEVGRTAVGRGVAMALGLAALLTVGAVPALQTLAELRGAAAGPGAAAAGGVMPQMRDLAAALPEVVRAGGPVAGNRKLQALIHEFEDRLEDESILRRALLPPVQSRLALWVGLGNEQAYLGRDEWLFYRPDVDYVTGPGFLDPEVQERRRRGGQAWEPAPQPDPLPPILDLHRWLERRGIGLVLLPTPVKPAIEPERFTARALAAAPGALQNPSFGGFVERLEAAGIAVVDPAPWLLEEKRQGGEAQYLATDTHWTPEAMERVAARLAAWIVQRLGPAGASQDGYLRRAARLEGRGDIAVMLRLPPDVERYPPRLVETRPVLRADGSPWRPVGEAEILLLGDSFTNIYSDPALGWGSGAGLAEQLSYHLGRPLDRIALNAGGAHATRAALYRDLETGRDRLAGKRLVIYQFATRELTSGDWKLLSPPPSTAAP